MDGMDGMGIAALVTIFAVGGLLFAEAKESSLRYVAKPIASLGFLATAALAGAGSVYSRWILAALILSAIGDVALLVRPRGSALDTNRYAKLGFLVGLGSFLLAHLAYIGAFMERSIDWTYFGAACLVFAGLAVSVGRWLLRFVSKGLRVPVLCYLAALSLMASSAIGTFGTRPESTIAIGALAFWLSDLSVANDVFVAPGFRNKAWGLPLYYAAQLLFAFTLPTNG